MAADRTLLVDPRTFIQDCVRRGRLLWICHVNIRLARRFIARQTIIDSVNTYEMVEAYPQDKYLPSYLNLAWSGAQGFHILFATDVSGNDVRVVT
jgi:hypothetical protein